jgi:hypothetical protein
MTNNSVKRSETIELQVADVWMDVSGVVRIAFKPTDGHTIEDAQSVVLAHRQLTGIRKCPVLADIRRIKVGADKSARAHYAGEESTQLKTALAFVTKSKFQRTVGNIFHFMNRPPYPMKMFTSESEALRWLDNYKTESS